MTTLESDSIPDQEQNPLVDQIQVPAPPADASSCKDDIIKCLWVALVLSSFVAKILCVIWLPWRFTYGIYIMSTYLQYYFNMTFLLPFTIFMKTLELQIITYMITNLCISGDQQYLYLLPAYLHIIPIIVIWRERKLFMMTTYDQIIGIPLIGSSFTMILTGLWFLSIFGGYTNLGLWVALISFEM